MSADTIACFSVIVAMLVIFYGPWQSFCTDAARQLMFEHRAAIFDIAARGDLDFSANQYKGVRDGINRMIRFSHYDTVPMLIYFFVSYQTRAYFREDLRESRRSSAYAAVEAIKDERIRAEVKNHVRMVGVYAVVAAAMKSLPCVILLPVVFSTIWATWLFGKGYKRIRRLVTRAGELIQLEADCA